MILSDIVLIQTPSIAQGTEGQQVKTWATLKTIAASFQPGNFTFSELSLYGLNNTGSDTKKMYYYPDSSIVVGLQVVYGGKTFQIQGVNSWPRHDEAILAPIQGA